MPLFQNKTIQNTKHYNSVPLPVTNMYDAQTKKNNDSWSITLSGPLEQSEFDQFLDFSPKPPCTKTLIRLQFCWKNYQMRFDN